MKRLEHALTVPPAADIPPGNRVPYPVARLPFAGLPGICRIKGITRHGNGTTRPRLHAVKPRFHRVGTRWKRGFMSLTSRARDDDTGAENPARSVHRS